MYRNQKKVLFWCSKKAVMFRLFYIFLLLCFSYALYSQSTDGKDTLLLRISKIEDDTTRVKEALEITRNYYLNNTELALVFADIALDESIKVNFEKGIADANNLKGIISKQLGLFEESRKYYKSALEIYKRIKYHRGIVNCYNNIGLSIANESNYVSALEFYFKGIKYLETYESKDLDVLLHSNLSNLYHDLNLVDEAMSYLIRAEKLAEEIEDKNHLIYLYNSHGSLLNRMEFTDSSLLYYKKSLDYARELNNQTMVAATLRNIGSYHLVNDSSLAIKYLKESLSVLDEHVNHIEVIRTMNQLTYLHYYHKSLDSAYNFAIQTKGYSEKIGFREGIKNSALYLSYILHDQSKYKEAYDYRLVYDSINSNFYQNTSIQSLSSIFQTLEYERREHELKSGIQNRKIRNLILAVIASGLLVLFLMQRNLTKRAQKKHEALTRELTSNAMVLAKQNEVFSKVDTILNENKHRFTETNQVTIQGIINEIRLNQNEESWNSFESYFNKVHKNFHKKLNAEFPNLSVNERRLCSLLRMNMTSKEISSITLQTAHSINIARGRLRKKLGLVNSETSLYSFLSKY